MKPTCLTLFLVLTAFQAVAQVREDTIEIWNPEWSMAKDSIAVPDFDLPQNAEALRQPWETINTVLRQDLKNSGFFEVVSEERMRLIDSPHGRAIQWEEWGSIETQYLVLGSIKDEDGAMTVEVRLYEIASRKFILGRSFKSKPSLARKTAHVAADLILKHLRDSSFATSNIVYTARRKNADRSRNIDELFIMDYDGYNPLPITRGGIAFSASAIKKGNDTYLAYAAFENIDTMKANYGIFLKPTLQSRPVPLFRDSKRRCTSPALSPDGKKVAFSLVEDGNSDVYVMNLDGTGLLRLTRNAAVETNPSWATGGRSLLFTSDRTGAPQIYQMDVDGLNQTRVTQENPYNDSASWNPRYDMICYVSRFNNDFDIFIMDMQTRKNYRVTHNQGSNETPCWSPDGEQLCFASNRSGNWQIYAINKDGSNFRQVTFEGSNRDPVWVE